MARRDPVTKYAYQITDDPEGMYTFLVEYGNRWRKMEEIVVKTYEDSTGGQLRMEDGTLGCTQVMDEIVMKVRKDLDNLMQVFIQACLD